MEIIPDPIHAGLLTLPFVVAALSLHFILWRPLLAYLDERHAISGKANHEADELEGAAAELLARIQDKLSAARQNVATLRHQGRSRVLAAEAAIVQKAREDADAKVTEAMARIQEERDIAAEGLRRAAGALSNEIASNVLGRPVA